MLSTARLERLRTALEPHLDALPDRPPTEPILSDSDASGGVPLDLVNAPSKQPAIVDEPNTDRRFVWLKHAESSYNPAPMPNLVIPASLPATTLTRGDLGSPAQHYSPIVALSKYPYRWCNKSHSQAIASAFFDQAKFWAREWDLYYLWDIDNHSKPLILVHQRQVQDLLRDINTHLNLNLHITPQQREDALVSRFPDHPRCTPRYLGRSSSRQDYENMLEHVPGHDFRSATEPEYPPLDDLSLEAFKQLMEESFEAQRAKNKATKAKKQQERLVKQKALMDQFKRAQRYLGLRPTPTAGQVLSGHTPAVDPALPAPFDFDQSVVFVCVDVESYERAHHKITEVGISTLDTRDLANVAPGTDGEKWRDLIRTRHFRIKEHAHLVNHEFVHGCPDRFYFGESTLVSLAEAPAHVAACFSAPFGAHRSNGLQSMSDLLNGVDLNEKRNLILLGHDTLGDVRYLQNLGYDPMKIDSLLEALDTAVMYRVWSRELNATSLGRILHGFNIAGHGLHNAGNDAAYTVQAMLAICVREASLRGSSELQNLRSSEQASRLAAAVEEAQERASNEAEGWSDHEGDGDGGAPVPLVLSPPKATPATISEARSDGRDRGGFRGRGRGRAGHESGRGRGSSAFPLGGHGLLPGIPPTEPSRRGRGQAEGSSRGRGRGRYRGSLDPASDSSTPGSQVR